MNRLKEMMFFGLIVVVLVMFCVAGCAFHAAAETTMGAGRSGNQAAANINADKPHGTYDGTFSEGRTVEESTDGKFRTARD